MISDRKKRQLLRKILIVLNIVLVFVLAIVTVIGIYSARGRLITNSMMLSQYYIFDLDHLENKQEEIAPDRSVAVEEKPKQDLNEAHKTQTPKIAILLTDLGLDKKSTQMSLTLPSAIGLGFLPYTTSMKPLMHEAMQRGHEIFLYTPFQLDNANNDPGMLPLLLNNPSSKNLSNLDRLLSGFINCAGVYGIHNEIFSRNLDAISPVIEFIKGKNMLLLLSNKNSLDALIKKYDNIIANPIILDTKLEIITIKQNLQQLVALAKLQGKVLGTIQGYPMTINILNEWIPSLIEQGVELVPVSALRGK